MRDLIEEYMEEIKQAGGVRSPVKVSEKSEMFPSKLPSDHGIPVAMEADNSEKVGHDSPAVTISNPSYHEQQSRTNYSDKSNAVHDVFSRDYKQHKQGHRRSHYYGEDQQTDDQGNHRSRASSSPERHRSHSRSHERTIDHKKQDYSNRKKYNNSPRTRDRWQNDTHRNHISDSFLNNAFSDRYDPSDSRNNWEDEISSDDKYVKPDKFYDKELN